MTTVDGAGCEHGGYWAFWWQIEPIYGGKVEKNYDRGYRDDIATAKLTHKSKVASS
jgi:hypothetical protein